MGNSDGMGMVQIGGYVGNGEGQSKVFFEKLYCGNRGRKSLLVSVAFKAFFF